MDTPIPLLNDHEARRCQAYYDNALPLVNHPSAALTCADLARVIQARRFNQIKQWAPFLNWRRVSVLDGLTVPFIRMFADYLCWKSLGATQTLPLSLIFEVDHAHPDLIPWHVLASAQPFPEEFLEQYHDRLDWEALSMNPYLTEGFIRRHADQLNLWEVSSSACYMRHVSNQLIVDFQDHMMIMGLPVERVLVIMKEGQLTARNLDPNLVTFLDIRTDELCYELLESTLYLEDWLVVWATTKGCMS